MKAIVLNLILIFVASAPGQAQSKPAMDKKFAAALEMQISCAQVPQPARAVRALQNAGIIQKTAYNVVDSINYFRVKKSLSVFGLKVSSVFAYDEDPKLFARGPGTSPGILIGIVVPYPVAEIQSRLKNSALQKITVEESPDEIGLRNKPRVRTEITCNADR